MPHMCQNSAQRFEWFPHFTPTLKEITGHIFSCFKACKGRDEARALPHSRKREPQKSCFFLGVCLTFPKRSLDICSHFLQGTYPQKGESRASKTRMFTTKSCYPVRVSANAGQPFKRESPSPKNDESFRGLSQSEVGPRVPESLCQDTVAATDPRSEVRERGRRNSRISVAGNPGSTPKKCVLSLAFPCKKRQRKGAQLNKE